MRTLVMAELAIVSLLRSPLTMMRPEGIWQRVGPQRGLSRETSLTPRLRQLARGGLLEAESEGPATWWSSTEAGRRALAEAERAADRQAGLADGTAKILPDGTWGADHSAGGGFASADELAAALAAVRPERPHPHPRPPARESSLGAALRRV